MSHSAVELCTLLIEEHLGELYSHIFKTLLQNGRVPLQRLTQLAKLSSRDVKHGLWVLIQYNCVYNYSSVLDPTTYYEANWRAAYNLTRTGKVAEVIQERLGEYARAVITQVLLLGHTRVGYLEGLPELVDATLENGAAKVNGVNGNHANGHVNGATKPTGNSLSKLHSTLRALAVDGYIHRVREYHVRSPADSAIEAQNLVKDMPDVRQMKGKKYDEIVAQRVHDKIQEWSDSTIPLGVSASGLKRRAENSATNGTNKRAKVRHIDSEDDEESEDESGLGAATFIDPNLIIRVNHDKFPVLFRNRTLVRLAERTISRPTSRVYEKMLQRIEGQIARCQEGEPVAELDEQEFYSPPVSVMVIAKELDPKVNLIKSIGRADPSKIDTAGLRRLPNAKKLASSPGPMDTNDSEEEIDEWADDGPDVGMADAEAEAQETAPTQGHRYVDVEKHLFLLSEEPHNFTNRDFRGGVINWNVEYRHLTQRIRQLTLEQIVQSRFGTIAVRIIRSLHKYGKLDEKRLQQLSLVASKELRTVLGTMQKHGFIELQEVPRDNQRMPARTMFLWFYDPDRVRKVVVEDTYKAMTRHLRRMQVEREKLKAFLEKVERTDVKGHEEEFLSAAEMETLRKWRATEDLLLGEVTRLDGVVMVLRDF